MGETWLGNKIGTLPPKQQVARSRELALDQDKGTTEEYSVSQRSLTERTESHFMTDGFQQGVSAFGNSSSNCPSLVASL